MATTPKPLTKTEIINGLAERSDLSKDQVKAVLQGLEELVADSLKDGGPGAFTLPGLLKITVRRKPATPARKGKNPFTGEETTFPAKPARNVVRVTALKALKDMV